MTISGWSTRNVADLAHTSLRAVRHYHEVGLLEEPDRLSNGFKVYRTEHLIRLVRIRRLVDLGFSLTRIGQIISEGSEETATSTDEALAELEHDLAEEIARLEVARTEVVSLRQRQDLPDVSVALADVADRAGLSSPDRSMLTVVAQVLGEEASAEILRKLDQDATNAGFDRLPHDASEQEKAAVIEQMLAQIVPHLQSGVVDWRVVAPPPSPLIAARTMDLAIQDLYNAAQQDVLQRLSSRCAAIVVALARSEASAKTPSSPQPMG